MYKTLSGNTLTDESVFLGFDIGSISLNTVILDASLQVVENYYEYCKGRPFNILFSRFTDILSRFHPAQIKKVAITGTGGKLACELIGGEFINEIIAQSTAVGKLYPEAKTIIEMGGEDSKLIFMERARYNAHSSLSDFSMNSICAAGTGSFLDQQAKRIGISIEKEFGELALKSENPPRIAGRCSVFAKSDMIHLQQIATPVHDIVAGLCFAVARNFKSNLGRGKDFNPPVIFQGGVAANNGVIRAFREILNLKPEELIIPEYFASMGAIGSVIYSCYYSKKNNAFRGLQHLESYLNSNIRPEEGMPKLKKSVSPIIKEVRNIKENNKIIPVYLGVDVGSLSTNLVLIDNENRVIARRYLPTASRPLEAIQRGLTEIYEEVGEKVEVKACGTTGSGRYLTGDFIGADTIQNEITAQATAAIAYDNTVDTIFEIGGQDSKYISIENGVVVDFEMNKVCAAGTGSFLEEQSEKLGINIIEEFGTLALKSDKPSALGNRCTVFIESDLNAHQQRGEINENLVGGLAYSIVNNYLQKVVGDKRVGNHIFFQGGVANNAGVVAAFEQVTGKKITIPPNFDVTGAIGMAMLARDAVKKDNKTTAFRGFDVRNTSYTLDKFTCKECSNQCEIRRVRMEGVKRPLYYGGRCEKYEIAERKGKGKDIVNLFEERYNMLLNGYDESKNKGNISIGIPRELMIFYQEFPFWRTFFQELGFQVVLSKPSDRKLVSNALEIVSAETCFPVELMFGHVQDLLHKEVDYIFTPFIVNAKAGEDNPTTNCNCPWIQSYPFMIKSARGMEIPRDKLLIPTLHPRYFERAFIPEITNFMFHTFGLGKGAVKNAIDKALEIQQQFLNAVSARGKYILDNLPEDKQAWVVIGRPYNTGDPELNLRLIEKILNLDVLPIPIDFLPLKIGTVFQDYRNMYWPNGQKIIAASRFIAEHKKLHAVYISNFRCGPDSFLSHFVREEMKGKPYLQLEIDEHSADAGLVTRLEAFMDSLKREDKKNKISSEVYRPGDRQAAPVAGRVLYFPYMNDASFIIAAAARSCGIESYSLPRQTKDDLEIGRTYTSSKECFPMICTTGSFIRKLQEPGSNPDKISFFMPDHNGPCRFGQYNQLQTILFHRLGYKNVKIISPSNDSSYEDISGGQGKKFRFNTWRGFVAFDLLRKMQQERRPYEKVRGSVDDVYSRSLKALETCIESGAKNIKVVLKNAVSDFKAVELEKTSRKPVVSIVGEIFMRDNAFCNGHLIEKLETLGAETLISPFSEWLEYSTYRYIRDSKWKGDRKGLLKARIQEMTQHLSAKQLYAVVEDIIDMEKEVPVETMLKLCNPYVHKDYDGDPPVALGTASALANKGISGIVNILPFTCMPGTLIVSTSAAFRHDHNNIPWVDIAYDGQDDASIETRLQAFMYQANEYAGKLSAISQKSEKRMAVNSK
ncbi:MAG: hypothetical protein JXJ22_09580 [Bacteroidales bacterium]|nr:hypothetical protein [Bacteroidales bacterium]